MSDSAYESAVKSTFETKPLKTVLMIDDEFPTYTDLAAGPSEGNAKVFRQRELAQRLYASFRNNNMLCDIENVADEVPLDSIGKSDLVVLDYHLGPGDRDSSRSIKIMRELASSAHFNTVVVFTAEPNLDEVWLEVMASLGGAWTSLPGELSGEAKEHWERLSDEVMLPEASLDAVMEYARRRNIRDLSQNVRANAQRELIELGVPPAACGDMIEASINVEIAKRAGDYRGAPRSHAVGGCSGGDRWVQCKNCFIVIHKKGAELTDDEKDPAGILAGLGKSLLAWRPNLIQIVVSEMQNVLELEALISGDELLKDPATHASLWYYLVEALGPVDAAANPDVRVPLSALIDGILDGVKRRLSLDPQLLSLASDALLGEIRDAGWERDKWPVGAGRIDAVLDISRTKSLAKPAQVFFRLNSFFSTEIFRRTHVTLGSIIQSRRTGNYFVVASPACDLTPRAPSKDQLWVGGIHPLRPVVCVYMERLASPDKALASASSGKFIFVEIGSEQVAFAIANNSAPSYEVMFFRDSGAVTDVGGKKIIRSRQVGIAPIVVPVPAIVGANERELVDDDFEIVGQLRSSNANRILQLVTQHLSRIGLDHISMPSG